MFDGAAALPGPLSVDDTFVLEQWAARAGSAVPDWALLLGVVAVTAALLLVRGRRLRARD